MKRVAVVQSNYIPWKGYFDLINLVDEFILFDGAQYTKRDWRNRNQIKTPLGPVWLTIPVEVKGRYFQRICDTQISDARWQERHWQSIVHNYARAKHFRTYRDALEALYRGATQRFLSEVNFRFLSAICGMLGITTTFSWSMGHDEVEGKTERLVKMLKAVGATAYLSGPAARAYIDEDLLRAEGISLQYMDYGGYPEYEQLHPPFVHAVSIVDLLLNVGPDAPRFLKSFPTPEGAAG
jgi:hypothetical protein